jgi:hypothetical protein
MTRSTLLFAMAVAACGGEAPAAPDAALDAAGVPDAPAGPVRIADVVIAAPGASGSGFGDPMKAVNGISGAGPENGSVDVYSLSYAPAPNESITLGWSGARLENGPGEDLAVFENPFGTAQGPFMDLIIVEVSRDGVTWRELAHDYVAPDETAYVRDLAAWVGFAGKTPVRLDTSSANAVDPFDRTAAGGDGFDLDDIAGDDAEAVAMRANGITQVRLVTAPSRINPDTGAPYVRDSFSNGADIDGMIGRYVVAAP